MAGRYPGDPGPLPLRMSIADPRMRTAALRAAREALGSEEGPSMRSTHLTLVSTDMLLNSAANDDISTARCEGCGGGGAPKGNCTRALGLLRSFNESFLGTVTRRA
jgi:hypothetical protein